MNLGCEAVATIRELMPGSTLWYLRLIKTRWFLKHLQLAVDGNATSAWARHETLQRKSYGNDHWWRPGETSPRGLLRAATPRTDVATPPQRLDTGPAYAIGTRPAQADNRRRHAPRCGCRSCCAAARPSSR